MRQKQSVFLTPHVFFLFVFPSSGFIDEKLSRLIFSTCQLWIEDMGGKSLLGFIVLRACLRTTLRIYTPAWINIILDLVWEHQEPLQ